MNGVNNKNKNKKYEGLGNVVTATRGVLKQIQKTNLRPKVNNIKKKNCNANGNPLQATRRHAQKNITNIAFTIAEARKKPTNKVNTGKLQTELIQYIKNYTAGLKLSQEARSRYNHLFCRPRTIRNVDAQAYTRQRLGVPVRSSVSSGSNNFGKKSPKNNVNENIQSAYRPATNSRQTSSPKSIFNRVWRFFG